MKTHYLTWYNVENLFDLENSSERPDWLQRKLGHELKGWNEEVLSRKILNLTTLISRSNAGQGPDILGVCEVENRPVLDRLTDSLSAALGRNYKVIHKDTADQRGIDIAFLYDGDRYQADEEHVFSLEVMKRNATRDIVQITLTTADGNELLLMGNHWPSRLGGKFESEPYRCMVGETLSYWLKRIQEIKGLDTPVLVMGDFNDEPFDRSVTEYALSSVDPDKAAGSAASPFLYNLMYNVIGLRRGTYVYNRAPFVFDQIMVSRGFLSNNSPFSVSEPWLEEFDDLNMVYGKYNTPRKFSRPSSSSFNPKGFSDHLPVSCRITETV